MLNTTNIFLAGFGGQGILFSGKIIAYGNMLQGKEVSWLPSYGPEMRGGTANCSVIASDEPIGSPLVTAPDIFVVMNLPSFEKYIDTVVPGGTAIINSSLIPVREKRSDIRIFEIPATQMAQDNELPGLANIIILGKTIKETGCLSLEIAQKAIEKSVPAKKAAMLEKNLKALMMGYQY